ncbi:hypothetical protein KP509_20G043200 [Ceratopteris richardii]|uniref:Germin-like protein n=3 Tax=Ceratopteris richardii TaxID=49495 RepID=A0A8T2SIB1_CERRI|nr:hypothetical protein KP509_20G043200 [Ceratopteris richardii]
MDCLRRPHSSPPYLLCLVYFALLGAVMAVTVVANDPDPLQDTCVADLNSTVKVNGHVCKAADMTTADDFSSAFLSKPGQITSKLGSLVTLANVAKFPALNTFGVSMARVDYAEGGLNPPHIHPRGSELLYLEKGSLYVGFITTENKLFAKTIKQGELFLFPKGLVHFQLNVGEGPAVGIAALTSQNPGTSQVARGLFASMPAIESVVLSKAFQIGEGEVKHLRDVIAKS